MLNLNFSEDQNLDIVLPEEELVKPDKIPPTFNLYTSSSDIWKEY